MRRRSNSLIGKSIAPQVSQFLQDNAKAIETQQGVTLEESMFDLANAISYGVCKALSSPQMQTAFSAGNVPPTGLAVGNVIFKGIEAASRE